MKSGIDIYEIRNLQLGLFFAVGIVFSNNP